MTSKPNPRMFKNKDRCKLSNIIMVTSLIKHRINIVLVIFD
jgi:hypothetical protein